MGSVAAGGLIEIFYITENLDISEVFGKKDVCTTVNGDSLMMLVLLMEIWF